jgi:hypothetical protein
MTSRSGKLSGLNQGDVLETHFLESFPTVAQR